jgi:hypothetical protein
VPLVNIPEVIRLIPPIPYMLGVLNHKNRKCGKLFR